MTVFPSEGNRVKVTVQKCLETQTRGSPLARILAVVETQRSPATIKQATSHFEHGIVLYKLQWSGGVDHDLP